MLPGMIRDPQSLTRPQAGPARAGSLLRPAAAALAGGLLLLRRAR
jgi:hypothetical protein